MTLPNLPVLVAHADWGSSPGKRWMARAVLREDRFTAFAPEPVGDPARLLARLRAASGDGPVLVGFDFPIGVPAAYARKLGIANFRSFLPRLGAEEWSEFYDVATRPEEVSPHRPFYPRNATRKGEATFEHLLRGIGVSSRDDLLRRCDKAGQGRRAASPIFWTIGGQQVGKATISGWRDVLVPALTSDDLDVALWPFEGSLEELMRPGRVVVVETYPPEFYRHLGVAFSPATAGARSGKRDYRDRAANAGRLLSWAERIGINVQPEMRALIEAGFGISPDGEDLFDATVGLFGMLNVVLGHRPSGEPAEDDVRKIEGWMLGKLSDATYAASGDAGNHPRLLVGGAGAVRDAEPGINRGGKRTLPREESRAREARLMHEDVDVLRAGHLEYLVTDLERAREFYVDLLGFVESGRDRDCIYLRGLEERQYASFILRRADLPGASHIAFRVADPDSLELLQRRFEALDFPTRWTDGGMAHGRALMAKDPAGLPVEYYHDVRPAERMLQEFHLYKGAHVMRLDHFNCQVPDVQKEYDFYVREMGFRCTEYTESEEAEPRLWAAWLTRKDTVHDLALMNGRGPRLHHGGFSVPDALAILRACDVLAGAGRGAAIERGPGRNGLSNAMFVYVRDPDGNRVELYTGDYLTADPDAEPIRWSLEDPRRQTFWGHFAPDSWFQEASLVQDLDGQGFVPTAEGLLREKPQFVT